MRVSYRWINEFVNLDVSADELADKLTMAGLEVDSVEEIETFGSVVGEIKDLKKSEKLYLAEVDIGDQRFNIVTADSGVEVGGKYPVVKAGEIVGGRRIEKKRFGEFVSEGMMLSSEELGLEESSSGLLRLDESFENGKPLSEIDEFDDYILDIELTPNRADALSILGVAREVRAIFKRSIDMPDMDIRNRISRKVDDLIGVRVEDWDGCPRYTLAMADVKIKPSPFFIRIRLLKSGIRPINNVVDITNYVMMALGQPLHAFDFNKLNGSIIVRRAKKGERILALDGREYSLDETMLVIADEHAPVAIAGVMGGELSSVDENTKTVALESAHFDPVSVRLTARKLKLHTESSHRFERGVDPQLSPLASQYALHLMEEYADASIYTGLIDEKSGEFEPGKIECSISGINNLLGSDFSKETIIEVLEYLNFSPSMSDADRFSVTVPTYRFDIEAEADIAEEVARCVGYENIPSSLPVVHTQFKEKRVAEKLIKAATRTLSDLGLNEAINYAFVGEDKLRLFDDNEDSFIRLSNPLVSDQSVMRTTLLCGLMENLRLNMNKGARSVALFEIGRVFFKDGDFAKEFNHLAALLWGFASFDWFEKPRYFDFYDIKAVSDAIGALAGVEFEYKPSDRAFLHPGRSAELGVEGRNIGFVGELHPDLYEAYEIRFERKQARVLLCEIDMDALSEVYNDTTMYEKLPKLPTVVRDLAIVVDKFAPVDKIEKTIASMDNVYEVVLFDVYENLEEKDKRSLTFRIVLKNDEKTFTDEEIDEIINRIFDRLKEKFNAALRG